MQTVENAIRALIAQGRESARRRGHHMKRGEITRSTFKARYLSTCRDCESYLTCDSRPMANGIDISGEAVAIGCKRT